jgi:hypothetical protein
MSVKKGVSIVYFVMSYYYIFFLSIAHLYPCFLHPSELKLGYPHGVICPSSVPSEYLFLSAIVLPHGCGMPLSMRDDTIITSIA